MDHIFYHNHCQDGFGAAYAAWKYYVDVAIGEDFCFYPLDYDDPLPVETMRAGDKVFMLDYSRKADDLGRLLQMGIQIEVIDHHQTAKPEIDNARETHATGDCLLKSTFDMNKSGAVLAWERFFPDTLVPFMFRHLQDRDLWKKEIKNTDKIHAALQSLPWDFALWDVLMKAHPEDGDDQQFGYYDLVYRGEIILEYQQQAIAEIIKETRMCNIRGYEVPVVNTSVLFSDVCHALLQKYKDAPFAGTTYSLGNNTIKFSLRSRGEVDVSEIAKHCGGGGHHNAAGFTMRDISPNQAILKTGDR